MNRFLCTLTTAVCLLAGGSSEAASPNDSLVVRFANRTRLVIYAPNRAGIQALSNYDLNKIVREMGMQLDSVPGGKTAISKDGTNYLKDTVLVITKSGNGVSVIVNGSKTDSTRRRNTDAGDRDYQQARHQNRGFGHDFDYGVSVGLNNWIQQTESPAHPGGYNLRPWGSRFIALSVGALPTLVRGRRASLKLYYGVEVAWNNFMFDGNIIPDKPSTGATVFTDAGRYLQKSKLTVCTIGVPVVPRITFYNGSGRKIGHFGVGGYVNYRLDSYRKIKEADGSKNRNHSNYNLENFRYGLMAHIGVQGLNFFVRYDLSPLFVPGLGPDVRTLTLGVGF